MKKLNTFGLSILSLLIIIPLLFIIKLTQTDAQYKTVKISDTTLKAEIADTQLKRIEGLMSKKSLPTKEGMLFIFDDENHHGIWMMNMSFSIDILWVNRDLEIADIAENAQPCKINCPIYLPDEKALYVLEANAGFVSKNKIQKGDLISIR